MTLDRYRLRRPPAAVGFSAVLIGLVGSLLAVAVLRGSESVVAVIAVLILAAGVWRGSAWARWAGIPAGLAALLPGAYGVWGSAIVLQDWSMCSDGRLASVATSYPAGYCGMVDWPTQIGTGVALISVGIAGLVVIATLLRHPTYFRTRGQA